MWQQRAFISGKVPEKEFPLGRFLPPFREGVFSAWAQEHISSGGIILDPFGMSPRMALELAGAGYKVISICSNPVTRFVLRMAAEDIQQQELISALSILAGSFVGDERLELHLQDLYSSSCPDCTARGQVDYFVWQKEPLELISKKVVCSTCGFNGETEPIAEDKEKIERFSRDKLTLARALSKIVPSSDPDRPTVESALNQYLPRALYALFTAINRYHALTLSPEKRNLVSMLLLSMLNKGNTLWGYPTGLERPKQLVTPPVFYEFNLWKVLENSVEEWASLNSSVPVYDIRKQQPQDGNDAGIWVFPGRMKDFSQLTNSLKPNLIAAVLPRPAPAYWTLSAMWGSWLWGKEILGGFRSVIRRQRFEWAWHTAAISSTLEEINGNPNTKDLELLAVAYESEPAYDLSICLAADISGREIGELAFSAENSELQVCLMPIQEDKPEIDLWAEKKIATAGKEFLGEIGIPIKYNRLQLAGLLGLMDEHHLGREGRAPNQMYYDLRDLIEASYSYKQGLIRFGGSEKSNDVGLWWLADEAGVQEAIPDRMEKILVNRLLKERKMDQKEIHTLMSTEFKGLQTVDSQMVGAVLDSYAEQENGGQWRVKEIDHPDNRRSDLEVMRGLIAHLGLRLGYDTIPGNPFVWMDDQQELVFSFHIIASALIDKIVFNAHFEPGKSIIVLPGSRANLTAYKIENNPRLKQKIREGWHFVKFRRIRWMAENPTVNQQNFLELISQDPLTFTPQQERLL